MVPIVSMAGEELLTLELKDFDVAEQLQMEASAVEMAMGQRGEHMGKSQAREKKEKKGEKNDG